MVIAFVKDIFFHAFEKFFRTSIFTEMCNPEIGPMLKSPCQKTLKNIYYAMTVSKYSFYCEIDFFFSRFTFFGFMVSKSFSSPEDISVTLSIATHVKIHLYSNLKAIK